MHSAFSRPRQHSHPVSPRPFPRHGFTLIELLTVIAIIGILASITIVSISKVRASAQATKCANNLRQIGVGLHLYMSDSRGGSLPPGDIWDRSIAPYLGPSTIPNDDWSRAPLTAWEMCPADKRDPLTRPRSYVASSQSNSYPGVGAFSRSPDLPSYNLSVFTNPARTVLICEFFTGSFSTSTQFSRSYVRVDGWLAPSAGPRLADGSRYHGKGQNWLFADGHIALLSDEQAVLGTVDWPNGYWRAFKD